MGEDTFELKLERGAVLRFVDDEARSPKEALYIGADGDGDWIFVPLSESEAHPSTGQALHGRCLVNGRMAAFTSKMVEVLLHPVTLWRIQPPTDATPYDLRDYKRIQCSVAASIEAVHRGKFLSGIIQDISKSGARCIFRTDDAADSAFESGEAVTVRCTFPGIPGEQAAPGKISDISKSGDQIAIGIRFIESAWWVPPYH